MRTHAGMQCERIMRVRISLNERCTQGKRKVNARRLKCLIFNFCFELVVLKV